jgi:membrane-associated protease RseP (regulator of RpoE activity)
MFAPEQYEKVQEEVEKVKSIVGKFFSIYDVKVAPDVYSFYCRTWEADISDKFEALRLEMKKEGYIPVLTHKTGEFIIHVQRKPRVRYRSTRVNLILLLATIGTTAMAGMWNWAGYENIPFGLEALGKGFIFFAFPLLLILGVHELGHYYMAKRHKVDASLPFFIPLPISPLGTLGAVISMREPIPNRKALVEIGAAGPICGLIVAIPVAVLGWYLTGAVAQPAPVNVPTSGLILFNTPLIYNFIDFLIPISGNIVLHPLAFAGWVGIFVTALNLIPAGQLDGGHVARAILGDKAKFLSYGALLFLLFVGIWYIGWLIIGLIIIFLGVQHPPPLNDFTKLGTKRKLLGLGLAFVMVISFVPIPFAELAPTYNFEFRDDASPDTAISNITLPAGVNSTLNYTFRINNTGNALAEIDVKMDESTLNLRKYDWNFSFIAVNGTTISYANETHLELNRSESANITISIFVPPDAKLNEDFSINVEASVEDKARLLLRTKTLQLTIRTE